MQSYRLAENMALNISVDSEILSTILAMPKFKIYLSDLLHPKQLVDFDIQNTPRLHFGNTMALNYRILIANFAHFFYLIETINFK